MENTILVSILNPLYFSAHVVVTMTGTLRCPWTTAEVESANQSVTRATWVLHRGTGSSVEEASRQHFTVKRCSQDLSSLHIFIIADTIM